MQEGGQTLMLPAEETWEMGGGGYGAEELERDMSSAIVANRLSREDYWGPRSESGRRARVPDAENARRVAARASSSTTATLHCRCNIFYHTIPQSDMV